MGSVGLVNPQKTYRAGKMRASNSVLRCRRIMFFEGECPRQWPWCHQRRMVPAPQGRHERRYLQVGGNGIRVGQRGPSNCCAEWHNQRAIDMPYAPFRLSAYSPRSMDRTQRMKRWFVHTMGSVSTVSDCTRRMARVCRSYLTMRNT